VFFYPVSQKQPCFGPAGSENAFVFDIHKWHVENSTLVANTITLETQSKVHYSE
jgi:hypothetical protein